MPRKNKPLTQLEEFDRFIEVARKEGTSDRAKAFERAFKKVFPARKTKNTKKP